MAWVKGQNFLNDVSEGVSKSTGVRQTKDFLQDPANFDWRDSVHQWVEGVDKITGQPSAFSRTWDAFTNPDWESETGGSTWIDRSWAHVNSKDDEPFYKYTVEEPLSGVINWAGEETGLGAEGIVGLAASIAGKYGGMDWGAGIGAGFSDVVDSDSSSALAATSSGLLSGYLNSGSSDNTMSNAAADYGWSDAATGGANDAWGTTGTVGAGAAAAQDTSGVYAYDEPLLQTELPGYGTETGPYGGYDSGVQPGLNGEYANLSGTGQTPADAALSESGFGPEGQYITPTYEDTLPVQNGERVEPLLTYPESANPDGTSRVAPAARTVSTPTTTGRSSTMSNVGQGASIVKMGLGAYTNYQQQQALEDEDKKRKRAMEALERMERDPNSIYRNDPGLQQMRSQRMEDVKARYLSKYGGTEGGAFARDLMSQGAQFDRAALNDAYNRRMGMVQATSYIPQLKAQYGGTTGGGIGQAISGGVNDYTYYNDILPSQLSTR